MFRGNAGSIVTQRRSSAAEFPCARGAPDLANGTPTRFVHDVEDRQTRGNPGSHTRNGFESGSTVGEESMQPRVPPAMECLPADRQVGNTPQRPSKEISPASHAHTPGSPRQDRFWHGPQSYSRQQEFSGMHVPRHDRRSLLPVVPEPPFGSARPNTSPTFTARRYGVVTRRAMSAYAGPFVPNPQVPRPVAIVGPEPR